VFGRPGRMGAAAAAIYCLSSGRICNEAQGSLGPWRRMPAGKAIKDLKGPKKNSASGRGRLACDVKPENSLAFARLAGLHAKSGRQDVEFRHSGYGERLWRG